MKNKKAVQRRLAHMKLRFHLADFARQFNTENPDGCITNRYHLVRRLVAHAHHGLRRHNKREGNFFRQCSSYLVYLRKGGSLYGKSTFNISNFI